MNIGYSFCFFGSSNLTVELMVAFPDCLTGLYVDDSAFGRHLLTL